MLPEGFIHPYQSFKFIRASLPEGGKEIGKPGSIGSRYTWKFFSIEYHTTDTEPTLDRVQGVRIVIWNRITRIDRPKKWIPMFKGFEWPAHVFCDIRNTNEYWSMWSDTAKQSRKKWFTQMEYMIVELERDEFVQAYMESSRHVSLKRFFITLLDRAIQVYGDDIHMKVLRHKISGGIVAGIATMDAFELSQSRDIMSFLSGKETPSYAGLALIDDWFGDCKNKGIAFPHFGIVWTKGQPKSWLGFTRFKLQFKPIVLEHPRSLFKITFFL